MKRQSSVFFFFHVNRTSLGRPQNGTVRWEDQVLRPPHGTWA